MPLYMYQASYTAKSMADQLKKPQDPVEVIRPALEDLGARIGPIASTGSFGSCSWAAIDLAVYEAWYM